MTDTPTLFQKLTPTEPAFHTAAQAVEVVNAFSVYETTVQGAFGGGAVLICLEAGETEVLEFIISADGTLTSHRMAEIDADGTVGPYQDAEGTHLWNAIHDSLGIPAQLTDAQLEALAAEYSQIRDHSNEVAQRLHLALIARRLRTEAPTVSAFTLIRDGIEAGEDVSLVQVLRADGQPLDEDSVEVLRVKYFAADGRAAEDYDTLLDVRHLVHEAADFHPAQQPHRAPTGHPSPRLTGTAGPAPHFQTV